MKHILQSLLLTLSLLLVGIGNVWGETKTTMKNLAFLLLAFCSISLYGQVPTAVAENGKSFILAAYSNGKYYALPNITTATTYEGIEVKVNTNGKVDEEDGLPIWTLIESTSVPGNFRVTYSNQNTTYYLYKNGNTTTNYNIKGSTSSSDTYWTFSKTADKTAYNIIAVGRGPNHTYLNYYYTKFQVRGTSASTTDHNNTSIILLEVQSGPSYSVNFTVNNAEWGSLTTDRTSAKAFPNTHYRLSQDTPFTITSGTATVTQNGNTFTIVAGSDCSIRINFEPIPTHNVTWMVNGVEESRTTYYEGDKISFPLIANNCPPDKTFMGWIPEIITTPQTEVPSFVNDATMGTSDQTYYAILATESTEGYSAFKQVEELASGKRYIFEGLNNSSKSFALSTNPNKGGDVTIYESNNAKIISNYTNSIIWTAGNVNSGTINSLQNKETEKYLSIGSDVTTSTNKNTLYWSTDYGLYGTTTNGNRFVRVGGDNDGIFSTNGTGSTSKRVFAFEERFYTDFCTITSPIATIEINALPTKTKYKDGETLDLSGLTLSITREDGSISTASTGFTTEPAIGSVLEAGEETVKTISVTISYAEKDVSFNVYVLKLEQIEVNTLPTKTTYKRGETFNPEGMVVSATWGEGEQTIVEEINNSELQWEPSDALQITNNLVTISYTHYGTKKNCQISVSVTELPTYTITWSVDGDEISNEYTEGAKIEEHLVNDKNGKVFYCWVTDPKSVSRDTEPVRVVLDETASRNITYYAVFATKRIVNIETSTYTSIKESEFQEGDYYLVDTYNNEFYSPYGSVSSGVVKGKRIVNRITNNDDGTISLDPEGSEDLKHMIYNISSNGDSYVIKNGNNIIGGNPSKTDLTTSTTNTWKTAWENNRIRFKISDRCLLFRRIEESNYVFKSYAISNISTNNTEYGTGYFYLIPAIANSSTTEKEEYSDFIVNFERTLIRLSKFGKTTYSNHRAYIMPDELIGASALASSNNGNVYLELVDSYEGEDIVPAGESLVLYGKPNGEYILVEAATEDIPISKEQNFLYGIFGDETEDGYPIAYDKEDATDCYFYKLTTKDEKNFGWYWGADGGGKFSLSQDNRAYLVIPKNMFPTNNVKNYISLYGEDPTDISSTTGYNLRRNTLYDLQGRKLKGEPSRGLYIINGNIKLAK